MRCSSTMGIRCNNVRPAQTAMTEVVTNASVEPSQTDVGLPWLLKATTASWVLSPNSASVINTKVDNRICRWLFIWMSSSLMPSPEMSSSPALANNACSPKPKNKALTAIAMTSSGIQPAMALPKITAILLRNKKASIEPAKTGVAR